MTEYHIRQGDVNATGKQNHCSESECINKNISGMVVHDRLSEEPKTLSTTSENACTEVWAGDTCSISSKGSENEDSQSDASGMEIDVSGDCAGHFGNIVVKNSSDVRFGNNTYYQGPVTIKQIVYSNSDDNPLCIENGVDNLSFKPDCVIHKHENGTAINCDKNIQNNSPVNNNQGNSISKNDKDGHWVHILLTKRRSFYICLSILLITTLLLTTTILVLKTFQNNTTNVYPEDSDELDNNTPIDGPDVNVTLPDKLKIVPRLEWVAQPPSQTPNSLPHPVPYVIILHTATENCSDQATCVYHVRYIQTFHMESKGWWDIGYNFLVGGDGIAYEGRGWNKEGANALGYNTKSIGIAFIGTFNNVVPPKKQIKAAKQIMELGVKKGYIASNYKILAHRQLSSTKSPGDALYEEMKTWPHWSAKP